MAESNWTWGKVGNIDMEIFIWAEQQCDQIAGFFVEYLAFSNIQKIAIGL